MRERAAIALLCEALSTILVLGSSVSFMAACRLFQMARAGLSRPALGAKVEADTMPATDSRNQTSQVNSLLGSEALRVQ